MTAVPPDPAISELRELFRNLREFRAVYEAEGVDEIHTPYGNRWSLWDLEYLLEMADVLLTLRQRQAIILCLVHNMREKQAAITMGVKETNPVMMYATLGLRNLLQAIDRGDLDRFRQKKNDERFDFKARRDAALAKLVEKLRQSVRYSTRGCWVYPTRSFLDPPLLRIPSVHQPSGFRVVHAAYVTFEYYAFPVPPTHRLVHHMPAGHYFNACISPDHFDAVAKEPTAVRRTRCLTSATGSTPSWKTSPTS